MADPSPAPTSSPAGSPAVPRPFDRSLLEATLADAARAVEAVAPEVADGLVSGPDAVRPPAGRSVSATRPPLQAPPAPPAPGPRLAAPGARALLSAATPAHTAPAEDGAVDAGRLRVGGHFGPRPAGPGGGGEVTLPVVGTRPSLPVQGPSAVTTVGAVVAPVSPAPAPAPPASAPAPPSPAPPSPVMDLRTGPGAPRPARPARRPDGPPVSAEQQGIRPWQPSDDDILPGGPARHRGRFRLR